MSLGPVSPAVAARARELLGLPADAPLTQAQMWEAAQLETAQAKPLPELLTADDPRVRACTAGGVDHDYRPHIVRARGTVSILPAISNVNAPTAAELAAAVPIGDAVIAGPGVASAKAYLRCVWCHGVTCGDADETDPCIEPYHHRVPHRTRLGITWPIGGNRPDPTRRNR